MHPYDSVVLITGASRGIGAAAAEAFDRAGSKVALAGPDRDGLERVAAGLTGAFVVPTDLSQVEDCEAMVRRTVEHFGRIDVLVNNAAINSVMSSDRLGARDIHAAMDTNFIGPMAATREAVREMRRQGRGQVINISAAGYLLGMPSMAPYGASKAAFSSWTRAMQAEWAGTEIIVTEFFMGYVQPEASPGLDEADDVAMPAQDLPRTPWASFLFRAQTPGQVAQGIVDCVREPRPTVYSSPSVRLIATLGLFARLRVPVASSLGRTMRARTGAGVFSPAAAPPRAADPKPVESSAVAALPATEVAVVAEPKRAKVAAKKVAAKKTTARKASAKKTTAKTSATKKAAKRSTRKVAALSPEATARVKAAAQRAADAAKGVSSDTEKSSRADTADASTATSTPSKDPSES